jgi:ACS family glucarate transporter-like MFS transporter
VSSPAPVLSSVSARRLVPLLLLVASAGYICRVAPTVVGQGIIADFHLTQTQLGTVFSAFLAGYTLCQIPSGWLADRVNPRRLFFIIVGAWTLLTLATAAITPAIGGVALLWAVRFLFGVTAAPTYPASARTIGVNLAPEVQGTANGFVLASIGIGSAITPLMLATATQHWGWRPALVLASAIAGIVTLLWVMFAPRNLRVEPAMRSDGGSQVLRSPRFWFLVGSYTLQGYIGYIFVFWFYLYLVQVRHFEVMRAAAVTALPWICTLVAIPLGGAISDAAVKRFGTTRGRRLLPLPALILSAALLVLGARTESAWMAVACLTLCTVLVIGTEGPFWATLNQVAGRHGGVGGGIMNFGSNLGGMISPVVTPWLAERIGWAGALSATALLGVVAGLLWLGVRIDEENGFSSTVHS